MVIINQFTKKIYYELVKITIDAPDLAKVIINIVVHHYRVSESIVTNWNLLLTLKFWSWLCYFLGFKKKLSIAFYFLTNNRTEGQNSTMEAYLRAFVNWVKDNWARLLSIAEIAYNNVKNASTNHIPFELNCGYHPKVFFKKDVDPHLKSRSINKLAEKLKKLMEVYC